MSSALRKGILSPAPKLQPSFTSSPADLHLFGISGGRDSVALLHLLLKAGYRSLILCHLDHGLRADSQDDAKFVQQLGSRHGFEVIVARENVEEEARRRHCSIETAAREVRYEFFAKVARQHSCFRLFLAHHADDQVETFLFNLFRGAGPGGLAGMRADSLVQIAGVELCLLRPLLRIWRKEIDAYIDAYSIEFRDDLSNHDPVHTRNRFRHQIIPAIEESFGREIRHSILRTTELLRAEDEWMRTQIGTPPEKLSVPELRKMPEALQRRLIQAWLLQQNVPNVGFDAVERVRALIHTHTAKTNLPGSIHARRKAKMLFLEKP